MPKAKAKAKAKRLEKNANIMRGYSAVVEQNQHDTSPEGKTYLGQKRHNEDTDRARKVARITKRVVSRAEAAKKK